MPGLVGLISSRSAEAAAERFATATSRLARNGRLVASASAHDGRCLVGQVKGVRTDGGAGFSPPALGLKPAPPVAADAITVFLHGWLSSSVDVKEAYAQHGASFVEHLDGEYAVVVLDSDRRQLLVATDPIGNYPIYWRQDADGFVFSSDLSAILAATPAARRLNLRAVADYLTIGAVFGDKTLAAGVQALDPGCILTCDFATGQVTQRRYLELAEFFTRSITDKTTYLTAVTAAFQRAVSKALSRETGLGLSLSGGLDSRAVLAAAGTRAASLETYTLGIEGCADASIARRLSEIAHTNHHYFRLDDSYLKDFLPSMTAMVSLTDGMYLSHGLTEMLVLRFLDQTKIGVLLRGHGGELAKARLAWPLHTDAHVYTLTTQAEVVDYLSTRANYITRDLPLDRVFTPAAARQAGDGARSSFAMALDGKNLGAAEACSYLYLRELNRRFTVPSLELFRSRVEVRVPFVDREFLRVLLAGDPRWRDTTEIHQHLIRSGMPKLLAVRNSNTGAPASAGPRVEFVLDKFNTLFKRLNIPGYRHYHNFDDWMRKRLFESVESELLSGSGRVQAFVPAATLATLIRESREGVADRSYLLQVLLILELWQCENGVETVA